MVNLLYTHTQDGYVIAIDTDRLLSGMDSDSGEGMAPDEMYLMLQADMISIKEQEEALQSEIEDIASKFHQLLETCGTPGTDSDRDSGTMAPPSTPSFMKTTSSSLTHVTNLETPTFIKQKPGHTIYTTLSSDSDEDTHTLFPDNSGYPEPVVNSSDGLPLDISVLSSKTLVVDNNSNYLDSPHNETTNTPHTPVIEAIPCLENTSSSTDNTTNSNSSSSSHRMSSSDGYPKSDESTDNQIVPECYDLDKEFMSRLQYYSDFTLDRQRKINSIVSKLGCTVADNSPCSVTEEILTRHVEGKESSPEKAPMIKQPAMVTNSGSSSDYMSTPNTRQLRSRRERSRRHHSKSSKKISAPLASSTMLDDSFSSSSSHSSHRGYSAIPRASSTMICESESSSGSSRRNRTNGSNPRACSTMLNESFLSSGSGGSGSSRHKSSSIPMANSTMISDVPSLVPCGAEPTITTIHSGSRQSLVSDNDCESVYTWSIHDGDSGSDRDISLEESYMKNANYSPKKTCSKPPLPPSKRQRSGSISSRDSVYEKCQDHQLHELLGEPCSKDILESVSVIQPAGCHDGDMFINSLYEDNECALPKSNTMPRSSTRMKLQDKSSGSSSIEARRASLPDLTSVCTSNTNDDQSVPESSSSASDEDHKTLPERLECQGKSSSSTDNPSVSVLEPSQNSQGSANIDSILTDSPNSVCSSGINAPYNSPGTNISSSSRVSCSTTSDARSSDSNANTRAPPVNILPRNIPVESPKVQNIDIQEGAVFKVPKQNLPLRHLFRFGRKAKSPKAKTPSRDSSAPAASAQGQSRRQLFPSTGTANLQQETRVMDKKAVIKKFKRFSSSFGKTDRSGKPKIETLANL